MGFYRFIGKFSRLGKKVVMHLHLFGTKSYFFQNLSLGFFLKNNIFNISQKSSKNILIKDILIEKKKKKKKVYLSQNDCLVSRVVSLEMRVAPLKVTNPFYEYKPDHCKGEKIPLNGLRS